MSPSIATTPRTAASAAIASPISRAIAAQPGRVDSASVAIAIEMPSVVQIRRLCCAAGAVPSGMRPPSHAIEDRERDQKDRRRANVARAQRGRDADVKRRKRDEKRKATS